MDLLCRVQIDFKCIDIKKLMQSYNRILSVIITIYFLLLYLHITIRIQLNATMQESVGIHYMHSFGMNLIVMYTIKKAYGMGLFIYCCRDMEKKNYIVSYSYKS